jgi:curved DNA-binding protein CbpA
MVKLDYDRDYYADLDLPATADALEVKKQFKKLGKYITWPARSCC